MLVKPLKINISSDKIVAFQEDNFSLDLPIERRRKLRNTFLKICGLPEEKHNKRKCFIKKFRHSF